MAKKEKHLFYIFYIKTGALFYLLENKSTRWEIHSFHNIGNIGIILYAVANSLFKIKFASLSQSLQFAEYC